MNNFRKGNKHYFSFQGRHAIWLILSELLKFLLQTQFSNFQVVWSGHKAPFDLYSYSPINGSIVNKLMAALHVGQLVLG